MANFRTLDDVAAWVEEHDVEALRRLIASPTATHPANREMGFIWLREQERLGAIAKEDEVHDFMRRQTVAAEESAQAAKSAARWAGIGAVIALASLVATAWPYMKLLDVVERLAK